VKEPEFVTVLEFEVESEVTAERAQRKNLPESVRVEAINRHADEMLADLEMCSRELEAAKEQEFLERIEKEREEAFWAGLDALIHWPTFRAPEPTDDTWVISRQELYGAPSIVAAAPLVSLRVGADRGIVDGMKKSKKISAEDLFKAWKKQDIAQAVGAVLQAMPGTEEEKLGEFLSAAITRATEADVEAARAKLDAARAARGDTRTAADIYGPRLEKAKEDEGEP